MDWVIPTQAVEIANSILGCFPWFRDQFLRPPDQIHFCAE